MPTCNTLAARFTELGGKHAIELELSPEIATSLRDRVWAGSNPGQTLRWMALITTYTEGGDEVQETVNSYVGAWEHLDANSGRNTPDVQRLLVIVQDGYPYIEESLEHYLLDHWDFGAVGVPTAEHEAFVRFAANHETVEANGEYLLLLCMVVEPKQEHKEVPRLVFVIKPNMKKFNSHAIFFGLQRWLHADYLQLGDAGAVIALPTMLKCYRRFQADGNVVGLSARQLIKPREAMVESEFADVGSNTVVRRLASFALRGQQGFEFLSSALVALPMASGAGGLTVLPGPFQIFHARRVFGRDGELPESDDCTWPQPEMVTAYLDVITPRAQYDTVPQPLPQSPQYDAIRAEYRSLVTQLEQERERFRPVLRLAPLPPAEMTGHESAVASNLEDQLLRLVQSQAPERGHEPLLGFTAMAPVARLSLLQAVRRLDACVYEWALAAMSMGEDRVCSILAVLLTGYKTEVVMGAQFFYAAEMLPSQLEKQRRRWIVGTFAVFLLLAVFMHQKKCPEPATITADPRWRARQTLFHTSKLPRSNALALQIVWWLHLVQIVTTALSPALFGSALLYSAQFELGTDVTIPYMPALLDDVGVPMTIHIAYFLVWLLFAGYSFFGTFPKYDRTFEVVNIAMYVISYAIMGFLCFALVHSAFVLGFGLVHVTALLMYGGPFVVAVLTGDGGSFLWCSVPYILGLWQYIVVIFTHAAMRLADLTWGTKGNEGGAVAATVSNREHNAQLKMRVAVGFMSGGFVVVNLALGAALVVYKPSFGMLCALSVVVFLPFVLQLFFALADQLPKWLTGACVCFSSRGDRLDRVERVV